MELFLIEHALRSMVHPSENDTMEDWESLLDGIQVVLSLECIECLVISDLHFKTIVMNMTPSVSIPPGLLAYHNLETRKISIGQVRFLVKLKQFQ